jgi:chromosome segregation ATPase
VKKAIDDMVAMLKIQQDDEVKKRDWCTAEFHETEVATAKSTDLKEDLQAKHANLESNIGELEQGLQDAKASIAELQLNLQRATEDRHAENLEFQKAVADQTMTIAALNTALDRLDDYYKQASMLQSKSHRQTPPVPQAEYAPNSGSLGVMQMIQKIVQETRAMTVTAKKAENEAQAAYEQTIADTNASVRGLQQEITTKTKEKARATKDKLETGSDISDTDKELEGMSKYTAELHGECDFVLKNFDVRQEARAQEIEALQQAKQVLSGASLS